MYHNETTNEQNLQTYIDGSMTCTMTGRWNKRQVTNNSFAVGCSSNVSLNNGIVDCETYRVFFS